MTYMTLNVRGLGEQRKRKWVKDLKTQNKCKVVCIQETQLGSSSSAQLDIRNCWGRGEFGFDIVEATGRSGGLLTMWDSNYLNVIDVIRVRNFLIVIGIVQGFADEVAVVNVYAPHSQSEKARVWDDLTQVKESRRANWIFLGDFNAVRRPEERVNSIFCPYTADDFNRFIHLNSLIDLRMGGHKFTYFRQIGSKLSKLDRCLVCPLFLASFPGSAVLALPRETSDHCPIILTTDRLDSGPKPFKMFNSWMAREGFEATISRAWIDFTGYGLPDSKLLAKFKFLKNEIKKWRSIEFHKENGERDSLKNGIDEIDLIAEVRPIAAHEQGERANKLQRLIEIDRCAALDVQQKSRVKWLLEGDDNSRFFHGQMNIRAHKNQINGLLINGQWCKNPSVLKKEVHDFFEAKFKECWVSRPKIYNPYFQPLSQLNADFLESNFSLSEIKRAIWACGSDKAPGPDGFTFKFIKTYWDLLKGDIFNYVQYFGEAGKLSKGCNASFLTLVAKVKDPNTLDEYRPISLIGSLYKIIAKLLANRLKGVIDGCIGEVQSAFVHNRNILEGPLIVNELCSWAKKNNKEMLLFKVDFNKAFDSVNWEYLDSVMEQLNFGLKWRSWIKGCFESATASVLVNGSPTQEFSMSKGVRQGDPLSPFLFIIAMEGLNVMMKAAIDKGIFDGIHIPHANLVVSHLFYADDALFVGDWSRKNISNLARILRCFHVASGLKVNFSKSRVFGVGVEEDVVASWAAPLGCQPGVLPFTYLGVPVGDNMNKKPAWKPIVDKFSSKLSCWKAKTLSFGGRLTLVKAVLGSLPTFYLSLFAAPNGVLEDLEKIRKSFMWKNSQDRAGIHWVAWEKMVAPKKIGGLGIGSLKALNLALLAKWWWKFKTDHNSLWVRVISGLHRVTSNSDQRLSHPSSAGIWAKIVKKKGDLEKLGIPFYDVLRSNDGGSTWTSNFVVDDNFIVALLRERIDRASHIICDGYFPWFKAIPSKVNCFIWRAKQGRIPTLDALVRRGIQVSSPNCGSCVGMVESANHVLVECKVAKEIMDMVLKWCDILPQQFNSVAEVIDFARKWGHCPKKRKTLTCILFGTLWGLWRYRNERVFNGKSTNQASIVGFIMANVFSWVVHRGSVGNASWSNWVIKPLA